MLFALPFNARCRPRRLAAAWPLSALLLWAALPILAWAGENPLLGTWTVNVERTQAVQPDNSNARWWEGLQGNMSASVSVGGVPVPVGGGPRPEGDGGIPNPEMLRCQTLSIESSSEGLLLTYHGVGAETLRPGAYRGMRSRWSGGKLSSNYESISRKVKRALEVQKDGRLLMSVTINPRKGKTRRFKRVFDRAG